MERASHSAEENRRIFARGTDGSNPVPSREESANHRFLSPHACDRRIKIQTGEATGLGLSPVLCVRMAVNRYQAQPVPVTDAPDYRQSRAASNRRREHYSLSTLSMCRRWPVLTQTV